MGVSSSRGSPSPDRRGRTRGQAGRGESFSMHGLLRLSNRIGYLVLIHLLDKVPRVAPEAKQGTTCAVRRGQEQASNRVESQSFWQIFSWSCLHPRSPFLWLLEPRTTESGITLDAAIISPIPMIACFCALRSTFA